MDHSEMQRVYELAKAKLYPGDAKPKNYDPRGDVIREVKMVVSNPAFYRDHFGRTRILFEAHDENDTSPFPHKHYIWFSISEIPQSTLYLPSGVGAVFVANYDFSQQDSITNFPEARPISSIWPVHELPRWAKYAIVTSFKHISMFERLDKLDSDFEQIRNMP